MMCDLKYCGTYPLNLGFNTRKVSYFSPQYEDAGEDLKDLKIYKILNSSYIDYGAFRREYLNFGINSLLHLE